jgi:antitoxin MazE
VNIISCTNITAKPYVSRGIRIPKTLIAQVKLGNEVEIVVERGQLVIRPVSRPRNGWDEQFRAMAEHGDDQLLDKPVPTKWDRNDWVW